jgi:hypothetical protein
MKKFYTICLNLIKISLWISLPLFLSLNSSALTSKVSISEGADQALRDTLSLRLTLIMNSLEKQNWEEISGYFTSAGLASFQNLLASTEFKNVNPLYEPKILNLLNGNYEIRDLKVKVKLKGTKGNPFQNLIFELNEQGLISEVHFAMEDSRYQEIIKQGELLNDFICRQPIIQFLEIFRTAYNRKDLEYLKKVYSDDALIIVGQVLQTKPGTTDYFEKSTTLSPDRIRFIKLKKSEYITRLGEVFKNNAFVEVRFDSIDIKSHYKYNRIYGIVLKQYWQSSSYSDQGYLFLMMDFNDVQQPIIRVRSWQPERFSDGSVVDLGCFIVRPPARN